MERTDIEKKRYIYPQYVPAQQLMKGLYTGEWAMIAAPPILGSYTISSASRSE